MSDSNRSMQSNGPAFALGPLLGVGIGVLATHPRTRQWMNDRAEWARTDGKEAYENVKGHAAEGFEAVKTSARNIKGDVSDLQQKSKGRGDA